MSFDTEIIYDRGRENNIFSDKKGTGIRGMHSR